MVVSVVVLWLFLFGGSVVSMCVIVCGPAYTDVDQLFDFEYIF